MVTQLELKNHFLNLGKQGALYVWGANCQIITEALMDKLFKSFGSSTYDEEYYENKLKFGKGKPGADCSGAFFPVSGYDTTAAGYYNKCKQKGAIGSIPRNKVCMVFKKNSNGKINHIGLYTGDGYVSEMASSTKNYQRKKLDGNGWDLWGMPDFVSNPDFEPLEEDGDWGTGTTKRSQKVYGTTADGNISKQPTSVKKYLPNVSTSSWKFLLKILCKNGSEFIRALQTDLKESGYYTGAIDGFCGRQTVMALQRFLSDRGFYAGSIDGKMGPGTVKGWQKYLNSLE